MDKLLSDLWTWFSSNGPFAVFSFFLLIAVWRLFTLYEKVTEKRIEEAHKSQTALVETKTTLEANSELLRELIVELRDRRRVR